MSYSEGKMNSSGALESLLKHVPATARYRRAPVSEEENALGPWQEAIERLLPPADDDVAWNRLHPEPYASETESEAEPQTPRSPARPFAFPDGEDGRHLREILEANRPALELIQQGIQRGKLLSPQYRDLETALRSLCWSAPLRTVVRLLHARARAAAADGDFQAAGSELASLLRMGQMLRGGDTLVVDHLIGITLERMALDAMRDFANLTNVPGRVRADLASEVRRSLAQPGDLVQSVRFDFQHCDLLQIDACPENKGLETLLDVWVEKNTGDSPWDVDLDEVQQRAKHEQRKARYRHDLLLLLEGHPRPFDKIATVRLVGTKVADAVAMLRPASPGKWFNLPRLWIRWRSRRRQRWLDRQTRKWPEFYRQPFWFAFDAMPEHMQKSAEEAGVAIVRRPTEEQLRLARPRLRRLHNPLGLLLANWLGSSTGHEKQQEEIMRTKRELLEQLEAVE